MKKVFSLMYLFGSIVLPRAYAFAHGGVEDGHTEDAVADVIDPTGRKYVMIAVAGVFALMIVWFAYARVKDTPVAGAGTAEPSKPEDMSTPPQTPPAV